MKICNRMRSDMKDYRREYLRSIARFFSKKNIFRFFSLMLITTGILLYMQTFANQTDIDFSFDTGNKLLVRGEFTAYKGTSARYLTRLYEDGSIDDSFNMGGGFDAPVYAIAVGNDEKIFVGGVFTQYSGTAAKYFTRLNADGTLDTGFNNDGTGFNGAVNTLAIQPDGKIIVGGDFTAYSGTATMYLTRLNADGTLDTGFNNPDGFNGTVISVAIESDGKIVVGGTFSTYNGVAINQVARLNADGTLDRGFINPSGFNGNVRSVAVENGGKILIGEAFSSYSGLTSNRFVRLNDNGSKDFSLDVENGPNKDLYPLAVLNNGKILVKENIKSYNGIIVGYLMEVYGESGLVMLPNSTNSGTVANEFTNKGYTQSGEVFSGSNDISLIATDGNIPLTVNTKNRDIILSLPAGTQINKADNTTHYSGIITVPIPISLSSVNNKSVLSAFKVGSTKELLKLTGGVATLSISTPDKNIGDQIQVFYSNDNGITWDTQSITNVIYSGGQKGIVFTTDHFTDFAIAGYGSGSFVVNNDDLFVTSTGATLNITGDGLINMRFINDNTGGTRSDRQSFSTGKAWMLSTGDGTKTVYAQFDTDGNTGATEITTSDSIQIDTAAILSFTGANPADNAWIDANSFTGQLNFIESNLNQFKRTRSGTDYSIYDSGLILMMNFDKVSALGETGILIKDLSQYGNNGSGMGGITWTGNGKWNGGYQFDGINDYVSTSINNLPLTNLTIAFWAYEDANNGGRIFGYENASNGNNGLGLYFPTRTTPYLIMRKNGATYDASWGTITTNSWNHYVVSISSTAGTKTYLNGIQVSSNTNATAYSYAPGVNFVLGSAGIGGGFFKGSMDEPRIYNRALSSGEVSTLYNSNLNKYDTDKWNLTILQTEVVGNSIYRYTGYVSDLGGNIVSTGRNIGRDAPPSISFTGANPADNTWINKNSFTGQLDITKNNINQFKRTRSGTDYSIYDSGLLLMMNFDKISALSETDGLIKDFSQQGNNGSGYNGLTWTANGKRNGGYQFDGTDDYINLAQTTNLDSNYQTVSMRVNAASLTNGYSTIIGTNNAYYEFEAMIKSNGKLALYVYDGVTQYNYDGNGANTLTTNTWYYLTFVYGNSVLQGYVNGVLDNSIATAGLPITRFPGSDLIIGKSYYAGRYFNGKIDEPRIRNRALSSGEIANQYNSNFNKYDINKWNFTIAQTGLLANILYRYTGYVSDLAGNTVSTGRNIGRDNVGPTTPILLSPASGTSLNTGTVSLLRNGSIDSGIGLSGYIRQISTGSDFATIYNSGSVFSTGTTLNGLADTIYYRRVYAFDSAGNTGGRSSGWNFIVNTILPALNFTGMNPIDNAWINSNSFTGQLDITENNLNQFIRTRNGTNYNIYDSGLVLMMNFDNVSALGETEGTIKDFSQYGNNGSGYNGITWTGNGRWNGGYNFDGINDYIAINDNTTLDTTTNFTFSARVNSNNISQEQVIFSNTTGTTVGWHIEVFQSKLIMQFYPSHLYLRSTNAMSSNTWHYITITYNNGTVTYYLDGIQNGTNTTGSYTFGAPTGVNKKIGIWYNNILPWTGKIDEVRMYNRALNSGDILQMWRSNFAKYETGSWLFTDDRQCMVNSTYTYTGYVLNERQLSATTGRTNTVNIPNRSISTHTAHFIGTAGFSMMPTSLSGQFTGYIEVNDWKGTSGRYTTIQTPLRISGANYGGYIDNNNIYFMSTGINVITGSNSNDIYISSALGSYQTGNTPKIYMTRDPISIQEYSCPSGVYGNQPYLRVDIPGWQNPDIYKGNLDIYLYE